MGQALTESEMMVFFSSFFPKKNDSTNRVLTSSSSLGISSLFCRATQCM
jgi:hypothetical protein